MIYCPQQYFVYGSIKAHVSKMLIKQYTNNLSHEYWHDLPWWQDYKDL